MKFRKTIITLHRDIGYFFAGMIVLYAISGIAVNHIDDWNPSFIIQRKQIDLDLPSDPSAITREHVVKNLRPLGEEGNYKSFDFPSSLRVKIYLEDGSVTGILGTGVGEYETIRRRPIFFEANSLHIHPKGWWLLYSDIFAGALIFITITGVCILPGRNGLAGRGKWLVAAGVVLPLLAAIQL